MTRGQFSFCLSLLMLNCGSSNAAETANDRAGIKWLPMPENHEQSTIAKWKSAVLRYTRPARDKLLGPPPQILISAEFYTYQLNEVSRAILPAATTTNQGGVLGAVLT